MVAVAADDELEPEAAEDDDEDDDEADDDELLLDEQAPARAAVISRGVPKRRSRPVRIMIRESPLW